jgi:hypothetical protein
MAPGSEKRRIDRTEFPHTFHLHLTTEQSGRLELLEAISQGIDINSHGLGIRTNYSFRKGDVVRVQLPSQAEGTFLPVFSQVVWSRKENDGFRVGLQFLS